ncbi:MAG: ImmA/IrrE family metallo-endopeptidase [Deltaproteobacteria bacterium]|jgi:Zn-dependent peptidase ImmA (M78 family)|nr:ImmA/IrrE family metallo-endopeptidase [Deltaproteobacteria bacterium]
MTNSDYALINKETLAHICSTIRVTPSYLAKKIGLSEDKVMLWISIGNNTLPSINQAKLIAKALKLPFAGLYMNKNNIKIGHLPSIRNLRTMSDPIVTDNSALNIEIADLIRSKDFLFLTKLELGVENTPMSLPTISDNATPAEVVEIIRSFFGLELAKHNKYTSSRQFYLQLRQKIESYGIFIHCFSDIDLEVARGVAIWDDNVPIIGINAKDSPPAKSFSIIHELVHIIKRQSTLCNEMLSSFSKQKEEIFCNAVAGEVLVPLNALNEILKQNELNIFILDDIKKIADRFCVSKEVIIRRLYDTDNLTKDDYNTHLSEIRQNYESEREANKIARQEDKNKSIPRNISKEAIDKNSSAICHIMFLGYGEGYFSQQDLSGLLGIKEKHIPKFIAEVSKW